VFEGFRDRPDRSGAMTDLVVRSRRVVLTDEVRPASIHVRGGSIAGVRSFDDVPADCRLDDAGDLVVMPGIVDTHVHVNEPGRTEWEGFETATRAAAAGGVTTIVEMPLNSIPATTTVEALQAKRRAAAGKCFVDLGFWGGLVPGHAADLEPLWAAGALGFKCFLVPSGVEEFAPVTESDLCEAMPILARLGAPLLAHAEMPGPIEAARARLPATDPRRYATYLATRPAAAEHEAIALLIKMCRRYGVRTHIVHLASSEALVMVGEARASGLPLTVETCPHYLTYAAEDIPDGATAFKCAPPLRERDNRERLWDALAAGSIQLVASDHSPSPPAMKHLDTGDFLAAWGGISSLQISLPVTWTGASARGRSLNQLAEWMCRAPARLAGLARKGVLEPGADADLLVWDPDAEFTVDARRLHHRHPLTPYDGRTLRGVIERTYLRGSVVSTRGEPSPAPLGRLLTR
jgi:allantoinase